MFDLVTTTLEIDTVTKSYSWILLGRGLIGQVKRFRNLLHFYWLWALLIVPQGCWIDTFWLVHLSRRGSLLRCLNPVKEKFRFLNFFSFFLNWPMKNFYFFIFKKCRDLTERLHLFSENLTVCWQVKQKNNHSPMTQTNLHNARLSPLEQ